MLGDSKILAKSKEYGVLRENYGSLFREFWNRVDGLEPDRKIVEYSMPEPREAPRGK